MRLPKHMKIIAKVTVILLIVGLITGLGAVRSQAGEGLCLLFTEMALNAMEFGYQTQSREACSDLVFQIMGKLDEEGNVLLLEFHKQAMDLVAVSCVKGVELAEKGMPFDKEKLFRFFYQRCIERER